MSNIIMTPEMERDEAFRNFIRNQKCPFRFKTETGATGTTYQYMMECDPDCAALIYPTDRKTYSCLRLMNVSESFEIFSSSLPKEED